MNERLRQYCWDVMNERTVGLGGCIVKFLFSFLSIGYRSALYLSSFFRGQPYRSSWKVISVGNITVGGTGKTPFVVYLSKFLRSRGQRPMVLMRGYMPSSAGKTGVSDEAMMLREQLKDTPVLTGADRAANMRKVESAASGRGVFVLDDGFQHHAVSRDLDIVLLDAMKPFGNEKLLPAGVLREPVSALRRARAVVLTRVDEPGVDRELWCRRIKAIVPEAVIVEAVHAPVSVTDLFDGDKRTSGLDVLCRKVVAVTAIAHPEKFFVSLERAGADVIARKKYTDHHVFTAQDVKEIVAVCRDGKTDVVVTTHKDAVKLASFQMLFNGIKLLVVNVELKVIHGETELFSRIDSVLDA